MRVLIVVVSDFNHVVTIVAITILMHAVLTSSNSYWKHHCFRPTPISKLAKKLIHRECKTENSPVALLFFLHLLRQPTDVNFQATLKVILS